MILTVVLAILVIASRWVVGSVRRRLQPLPRPSGELLDSLLRALASSSPEAMPVHASAERLPATDEQLCHEWCVSYGALVAACSGGTFMRVVEERCAYLDELERRNPAGFAAWLASGAIASDNPLPYLSLAHVEPAPINWDDLIEGPG